MTPNATSGSRSRAPEGAPILIARSSTKTSDLENHLESRTFSFSEFLRRIPTAIVQGQQKDRQTATIDALFNQSDEPETEQQIVAKAVNQIFSYTYHAPGHTFLDAWITSTVDELTTLLKMPGFASLGFGESDNVAERTLRRRDDLEQALKYQYQWEEEDRFQPLAEACVDLSSIYKVQEIQDWKPSDSTSVTQMEKLKRTFTPVNTKAIGLNSLLLLPNPWEYLEQELEESHFDKEVRPRFWSDHGVEKTRQTLENTKEAISRGMKDTPEFEKDLVNAISQELSDVEPPDTQATLDEMRRVEKSIGFTLMAIQCDRQSPSIETGGFRERDPGTAYRMKCLSNTIRATIVGIEFASGLVQEPDFALLRSFLEFMTLVPSKLDSLYTKARQKASQHGSEFNDVHIGIHAVILASQNLLNLSLLKCCLKSMHSLKEANIPLLASAQLELSRLELQHTEEALHKSLLQFREIVETSPPLSPYLLELTQLCLMAKLWLECAKPAANPLVRLMKGAPLKAQKETTNVSLPKLKKTQRKKKAQKLLVQFLKSGISQDLVDNLGLFFPEKSEENLLQHLQAMGQILGNPQSPDQREDSGNQDESTEIETKLADLSLGKEESEGQVAIAHPPFKRKLMQRKKPKQKSTKAEAPQKQGPRLFQTAKAFMRNLGTFSLSPTDRELARMTQRVMRFGFQPERTNGGHHILRHPETRKIVVIPDHPVLDIGTARGIIQQAWFNSREKIEKQ